MFFFFFFLNLIIFLYIKNSNYIDYLLTYKLFKLLISKIPEGILFKFIFSK